MDAIKIAFETIIVGALALPWMFLLIDLFCPAKEALIGSLVARLKDQTLSTVAGAVLFAMAYLVGSSVARVAEDFFNDSDLGITVTEDSIRTSVYCQPSDPWLLQTGVVLTDKTGAQIDSTTLCPADAHDKWDNNARQAFAVQEGALLLTSAGNTDKIRYLRQQIVVLRGAALDGVLVTVLCLFGVCSKQRPWGRRVLVALSGGILSWALYSSGRHVHDHWGNFASEPPLMEGVLIAIGLAGLFLAWKSAPERSYGCGLIFSALVTLLAFSGWWSTEVLYDRTVIYFFYAQTHANTLIR